MCGGGVSLVFFFLVVSFYFLFKFVGSFFSMICLSFGGLLVVFVGSLTG